MYNDFMSLSSDMNIFNCTLKIYLFFLSVPSIDYLLMTFFLDFEIYVSQIKKNWNQLSYFLFYFLWNFNFLFDPIIMLDKAFFLPCCRFDILYQFHIYHLNSTLFLFNFTWKCSSCRDRTRNDFSRMQFFSFHM